MSQIERLPGELPGVFSRQDGIKPYLAQSIATGALQCFIGSFQLVDRQGFFVTPGDQHYLVLRRDKEPHPLIRHLRAASPGVTETDGGGFRLHQGFAVIRATSPTSSPCWLLVDASIATAAIRAIEDAFQRARSCNEPRACVPTT